MTATANSSFAAWAFGRASAFAEWTATGLDAALVRASIPAWLICLACLSPAVYRIARRKPRYLDPIWGLVALLALNRISFLLHVSATGSHASALLLALAMAWLSISYQHHDRSQSDA